MSLDQLRNLRRSGHRPAMVTVIVGKPRETDDGPSYVVIDRGGMDLRPLMGLPVHLIDVSPDPDLTLRTLDDLQDLGAVLLGGSTDGGSVGVSPEHERAITRYWRLVCPA